MNQQSILFGNGFNLLTQGTPSWDDLIYDISSILWDDRIPNTLKYEAIILGKPYNRNTYLATEDGKFITTEDGRMILLSSETSESKLKRDIASRVKNFKTNPAYYRLAELKADHYLTTNYDNTLIFTIGEENLETKLKSERLYSLRRLYSLTNSEKLTYYWPIHGNIDTPPTIMLGFDHYCGALNKIESYIKGALEMPRIGLVDSISDRLKAKNIQILSWVDLFFISDIHIIGLGLSFQETDLWWLLNKRARMKWAEENITNRIFFYPTLNFTKETRQMLRQFDVEIIEPSNYSLLPMDIYMEQLEKIHAYMYYGKH